MMRAVARPRALTIAVAAALVLGLTAACGGGDQQALDEEAVRSVVATEGAAAFADAGVAVSGGLECDAQAKSAGESDSSDASAFTVSCTGTTDGGSGVTLEGEGTLDGETAKGTFTGKEGDQVVFEQDCLGC